MVIHVEPLLDSQWLMGYLPRGPVMSLSAVFEWVCCLWPCCLGTSGGLRSDVSVAGNCSLIISLKCHFITTLLLFFIHKQNWRRGRVKAPEPGWGNNFSSDLFFHHLAKSFASFSKSPQLHYNIITVCTQDKYGKQGTWWCNWIHFYMLHIRGHIF